MKTKNIGIKKSFFNSVFLSLVTALMTAGVETSYADRVITPKLTIRSVPALNLLGLTVEALNAGATISERVIPSPSPSSDTAVGSFGRLLSGENKENRELIAALDLELTRVRGEVDALFAEAEPVPPAPAPVVAPVPELGMRYDLVKFKSCAAEVLTKLEQLIRLESLGNHLTEQNEAERNAIFFRQRTMHQLIRTNRGDGASFGVRGVICGKFLGRAGFNSLSLLEEFKLVSLISSRSGEGDFERILTAAVVANHRDTPPAVRQVWKKYWELLSFEANFKKEALPSWEIFRGQLGRYVTVEGLMGPMLMISEELERHYAAGIQFEAALRN